LPVPVGPIRQDVRLLDLDVALGLAFLRVDVEPLVVVVHGDRDLALREILSDDVLVEEGLDLRRRRIFCWPQEIGLGCEFSRMMSRQSLMHSGADVDVRARDDLVHFPLRLVAERASQARRVGVLRHGSPLCLPRAESLNRISGPTEARQRDAAHSSSVP
jgi:hypothetical protein